MEIKAMTAVYYEVEPGDATHYEFVIVPGVYKPENYITVTSACRHRFYGYSYSFIDIYSFINKAKEIDINAIDKFGNDCCKDVYRSKYGLLIDHYFVRYIINHSQCNPFTALAAAFCMADYYLSMV